MSNPSNDAPKTKDELEAQYGEGNVWDTSELHRDFDPHSYVGHYVEATRKSDGIKGLLMFQHTPRFFFRFEPFPER